MSIVITTAVLSLMGGASVMNTVLTLAPPTKAIPVMAGATMTMTVWATPTTESQIPSVAGESVKAPNPSIQTLGETD